MGGEVLSIDFDRDTVRAVVVRRRGRSGVVERAVEARVNLGPTGAHGTEYGPAIDAALAALKVRPPRRLVAVSAGARSFTCELSLPLDQAKKLSREKLEHAASWEVEPYLDFPAAEGLFSVTVPKHQVKGSGSGGASPGSTALQVCVASREGYGGLESACQARGLKLQRLYAADTAFAYSGAASKDPLGLEAIVALRSSATAAAIKKGPEVVAFRSIPAIVGGDPSAADELVWAVAETIKEFAEASGPPERVILTDAGATIPTLAEQLKVQTGIETAPWSAAYTNGVVRSEAGVVGPQFATAIGGALQELRICGSEKRGVDDRVPVGHRLKNNIHVAAISMVVVLVAGMAAHYAVVKTGIGRLEVRLSGLKDEEGELKHERSVIAAMEEQMASLRGKIAGARKETDYLGKLANARPAAATLLEGVSRIIPYDVVLSTIDQEAERDFAVSGCGLRASSISAFVAEIQQASWCEYVNLEAINEADREGLTGGSAAPATVLAGDSGQLTYTFRMSLRLKAE